MTLDIPPLYTTGDIARECGVAPSTACNWHARGKLPEPAVYTTGGQALWIDSQVADIVAAHRAEEIRRAHAKALRAALAKLKGTPGRTPLGTK